jgi:hypothetical protein
MSNRSFSDLPSQQRRERIAAVLALGLSRILDQRFKISANSRDPSLELISGLRLSPSDRLDFSRETLLSVVYCDLANYWFALQWLQLF